MTSQEHMTNEVLESMRTKWDNLSVKARVDVYTKTGMDVGGLVYALEAERKAHRETERALAQQEWLKREAIARADRAEEGLLEWGIKKINGMFYRDPEHESNKANVDYATKLEKRAEEAEALVRELIKHTMRLRSPNTTILERFLVLQKKAMDMGILKPEDQ